MLALPFQRVSPVDMRTKMSSFINQTFGDRSDLKFEGDINGFQSTHSTAASVTETSEEVGFSALLRIIFQLKNIAPRLYEYENELNFSFSYLDAFRPTKKIQSNSLYYDLCTFLWNYAALQSQIGSRVDRSTEEGIRSANKHFQQSAGALTSIKDNYITHIQELNNDVSFGGPINISVIIMMVRAI